MSDEEYERVRRTAYFQYFRVVAVLGALLGATLPALFGLGVAVVADALLAVPPTVSVGGARVSVLFLAKAGFTVEVLRETVVMMLRGEPEIRKIGP